MRIQIKHAFDGKFNTFQPQHPWSAAAFSKWIHPIHHISSGLKPEAWLFGQGWIIHDILQSSWIYHDVSQNNVPLNTQWFIMVHHHFPLWNDHNWTPNFQTQPHSQARQACPRSDQLVSIEASFFHSLRVNLRALLLIGLAMRVVRTGREPAIMQIYIYIYWEYTIINFFTVWFWLVFFGKFPCVEASLLLVRLKVHGHVCLQVFRCLLRFDMMSVPFGDFLMFNVFHSSINCHL